ncbi:MAG: HAMP domain-containing sensor histidine kinase [Clostridia bacterium]
MKKFSLRKLFSINLKDIFSGLFNTKSYFTKNYVSYMILILGSFFLTGIIFITQIGVYSLEEKNASLSYSVERAKDLTEIIHSTEVSRYSTITQLYSVNMMQIAEEAASTLLVCDLEGNITFYYDPNNPDVQKNTIDKFIVTQTLYTSSYSEIGDLYGFFDEMTYINTAIAYDSSNTPESVILIGMPSKSIVTLVVDLTQIFLIILAIMFVLILIVTYFITSKITLPLKNIAEASLQFAKGDFSFRVPENNDCIEIDDLSKSINNLASELAVAERNRTTFIENVSHELKTPMTSIGGFVDGILDGTIPPEKQNYYLQIISDEVKRLSRLTVRMLQTSKVHDENFTINIAPFNFTEIISRIIISFETKILAKNLDIQVNFPDEDVIAMGDRDNIYQVVYNLVDNAVKFTKPGQLLSITVDVTNGVADFVIANMGDTISEEKLLNIFNRFYKVDSSRSEDTTGAGLGLYLVKKIVMLHGDEIKVTSVDGLTTFSFALALHKNQKLSHR